MSEHHFTPSEAIHKVNHRVNVWWRFGRQCYHFANRATHHTLGALVRIVVVAYFLFCAVFLTLRYAVLPNIDYYKADVERIASGAIGRPVTISTIYASWKGLRPYLFLGGVAIHDPNGRGDIRLPGVAATFSWWSAVFLDVRLHSLEVSRPDIGIERDADGKLYVGGFFIDPSRPGDGKGLDWVLRQHEIVVRDGSLGWRDARRPAGEFRLEGITFRLVNRWQHHRFALRATPPEGFAAPIDVRADFQHPHFARRVSDFSQWTGTLYADLRDTDLAAWKAYVDYPAGFEVSRGKGAVRAWLDFDRAKVANFTADLQLADVSARFRNLAPLDLLFVNGRVSVREEGVGARWAARQQGEGFGARGHAVSVSDLSLQTADGLRLPATTISETHIPAQKGQPERTEVSAKSLDLAAAAALIERLPLPRDQLRMLEDFAPSGRLKDFSAQWSGSYPDIVSYSVKGDFAGLSIKAQPARPARPKTGSTPAQAAVPAIPGVVNLTGAIEANDRGGSITLASEQARIDLPGYFHVPEMPFEQLRLSAAWSLQGKQRDQLLLDMKRMEFVQDGVSGSLSGRHLMPLVKQPGAATLGDIDLTARIDTLELNRVGRYLPVATPPDLRSWLTLALAGGRARDVEMRLKGDLAGFPFRQDGPDRQRGEFTVTGRIEDGLLNYTPERFSKNGRAPYWPLLEDIDGRISFNRTRMEIVADSARSHKVALSDVKAVIADLSAAAPLLQIDGNAAGPLQELLGYTVDSPVGEWIARFTDETRATGNAKLALKLQLPLNHVENAKVNGTLQFAGNDVALFSSMPPLIGTQGRLTFDEHGFSLSGVRANFLGGAVNVGGGTQKDGSILVKADGTLAAAGLRRSFAAPAMQRIADRIGGSTRYGVTVSVRKGVPEVVVDSSMQGISLDFPAPLRKAANDTMPVRFELIGLPRDEGGMARDEMRLQLGPSIAARYLRQKGPEKDASWSVVRGGVGVNVPAPVPDGGLIANVNLRTLSIDAWSKLVGGIIGTDRPKAGAAAGGADALNISQYIEPEFLAARASELIIGGKKLDNVVVGASHQKGIWQANIDSEQASGYVTWNETLPGQVQGKATARLTSLIIPKTAASEVGELLEGKGGTTQMPALDIIAENFELYGKKLGRLELVANNIPGSVSREWRINKLSLVNPDGELKGSGKWTAREGGDSATHLDFTLEIANAGRLLERFGFANVLRNGRGKMEGQVGWKGLPFSLDAPSLSGGMTLAIERGQFLQADPGVAKLLSVLSLQSIPRRLTLDFRDVFSEGFAFDNMTATAQIASGILKTDNFKMRGVNATALMEGTVDIARETQNLHVVVIPEINAGAASVVYGLAVNPVIGVGTFLAQLFLREPIMRAATYEMQVTGQWKDPVVTKLDRKGGAPTAPKATEGAGG